MERERERGWLQHSFFHSFFLREKNKKKRPITTGEILHDFLKCIVGVTETSYAQVQQSLKKP